MSKESSERNYDYDDDDDDNHDGGDDGRGDDVDIKLDGDEPDGDNVEHGPNQSVLFTTPTKSSGKRKRLSFTDLCAESSKKRNETFEQRFIGSESLPGNNAVQSSVAKDVSDEECLMQCVEILNKMEEIDDDSYSKALKLFHDDATWRKIFLVMPDQRRKNFILQL